MFQLPTWSVFVLDGIIILTLFGCFTLGVRRGLFEHTLTTLFLVLAVIASIGVSASAEFIPNFPYKTLFFAVFPMLTYILVLLGFKKFFHTQLMKLDGRDVPAWEAILGGMLGLSRGLVIVILLGVTLTIPAQLVNVRITQQSPISWELLTPLHDPISINAQQWVRNSIKEAQTASKEAEGLSALIKQVGGQAFLDQILGGKPENTLERKRKQLEKNKAAKDILGENN